MRARNRIAALPLDLSDASGKCFLLPRCVRGFGSGRFVEVGGRSVKGTGRAFAEPGAAWLYSDAGICCNVVARTLP
jgi:hypothetical protein